eukprot:6598600-Prymnesium_polylepis.1
MLKPARGTCSTYLPGGRRFGEERLEHHLDVVALLGGRLIVADAIVRCRPLLRVLLLDLPLLAVGLVAAQHQHAIAIQRVALRLDDPVLERVEGALVVHVEHEDRTLRVLVELATDVPVMVAARHVEKVDAHRLALDVDRLDAKVDANRGDVLANKLLLADCARADGRVQTGARVSRHRIAAIWVWVSAAAHLLMRQLLPTDCSPIEMIFM